MHPHDERPYSYCPMCGGDLEPRSLKQTEPERLVCVRCGFVFYLDPKVAVGTIIRDETNRIVLVRRAIEPGYGKWVYPGGYVDRGELVQDSAVSEAREEAGVQVRLDVRDVAGRNLRIRGPVHADDAQVECRRVRQRAALGGAVEETALTWQP